MSGTFVYVVNFLPMFTWELNVKINPRTPQISDLHLPKHAFTSRHSYLPRFSITHTHAVCSPWFIWGLTAMPLSLLTFPPAILVSARFLCCLFSGDQSCLYVVCPPTLRPLLSYWCWLQRRRAARIKPWLPFWIDVTLAPNKLWFLVFVCLFPAFPSPFSGHSFAFFFLSWTPALIL